MIYYLITRVDRMYIRAFSSLLNQLMDLDRKGVLHNFESVRCGNVEDPPMIEVCVIDVTRDQTRATLEKKFDLSYHYPMGPTMRLVHIIVIDDPRDDTTKATANRTAGAHMVGNLLLPGAELLYPQPLWPRDPPKKRTLICMHAICFFLQSLSTGRGILSFFEL